MPFFLLADYELVWKQGECGDGIEKKQGRLTLDECANACRETAEMFDFGTNKFGKNKCDGNKCDCYCELGTENYQCKKINPHNGFNLYAFIGRSYVYIDNTVSILKGWEIDLNSRIKD